MNRPTQRSKRTWHAYIKEYWFLGIVAIIVCYLLVQLVAMVVYVFLPDQPSDTAPYFPHKIELPDGSTQQDNG